MFNTICVLDFETTGFDPEHEFVTEIGVARLRDGKITSRFETLVNFGGTVSAKITELTGITTEACQRGKEPRNAFAQLKHFIGTDTIVCHNAAFDIAFLNRSYQRYGATTALTNPFLCTALLAQQYAVGREIPPANVKLETLCAYFDIRRDEAHRAMSDVLDTAKVLEQLFYYAEGHHEGWADAAEPFIAAHLVNRYPAPYHGGRQSPTMRWLPDYAKAFDAKEAWPNA